MTDSQGGPPDPRRDPAASADLQLALHSLLLEFVGVLPDDLVVAARRSLAAGRLVEAAETVTFGLSHAQPPVTDEERDALRYTRTVLGLDPTVLDDLPRTSAPRPQPFFVDAGPSSAQGAALPGATADDAVVATLETVPGIIGVWRGWRHSLTDASWPPPRPVYVVEVRDIDALRAVIEAFYGPQAPVPAADGPLVEAYPVGDALPDLHRQVQVDGALVSAVDLRRRFQLADVFDVPEDSGRVTRIPRLDVTEARRLADRLDRGRVCMVRGPAVDDVLDPGRAGTVPRSARTDGRWIWSEEAGYYLREHAVPPPAAFLAYLREHVDESPVVPDAVVTLAQRWWERFGGLPWWPVRPLSGPADVSAALHRFLLHLASRTSDSLVLRVRQLLAADRAGDAAQLLADIALAQGVKAGERDLLVDCLDAVGLSKPAGQLRSRPVLGAFTSPLPAYVRGDDQEAVIVAEPEVVRVLAETPGVLGVWRAWRRSLDEAGWNPARPVYLVECVDDDSVAAVLGASYGPSAPLHDPVGPLVVPYASGDVHPPAHTLLMERGLLVYVRTAPTRFRVVSLSVEEDPRRSGQVATDRPARLLAEEAARLVARLAAGRVIGRLRLAGASTIVDEVDPQHFGTVPQTVRTGTGSGPTPASLTSVGMACHRSRRSWSTSGRRNCRQPPSPTRSASSRCGRCAWWAAVVSTAWTACRRRPCCPRFRPDRRCPVDSYGSSCTDCARRCSTGCPTPSSIPCTGRLRTTGSRRRPSNWAAPWCASRRSARPRP